MTKKKNGLILPCTLLLSAVIALLLLLVPAQAQAAVHYEGEPYKNGEPYYYVNKEDNEYWVASNGAWRQCELFDGSDNLDLLTSKIRSSMLNRDDAITVYLVTDNDRFGASDTVESGDKYVTDILDILEERVYEPTDNPASGDYLRMSSSFDNAGTIKIPKASASTSEYSFYRVTLKFSHFVTAEQGQLIKDFVKEWNELFIDSNELIANSTGDEREYYIVKTIYNFITKNTTYDTEVYMDKDHTQYPVDGNDYLIAHSAFGALFGNIDTSHNDGYTYNGNYDWSRLTDSQDLYRIAAKDQGKAVCEGYCELFYYMCRYNGIDCRIIEGDYTEASGKDKDRHAWNMVKLKDSYDSDYEWYAVDTTFAAPRTQRLCDEYTMVNYDYFLRGTDNAAFSANEHQQADDEYSAVISKQSKEDYRFLLSDLLQDKSLQIFASRRRSENKNEIILEDGRYNFENYVIINADNSFSRINADKNIVEKCDGFSYNSTGYWYSFELIDFAEGIEYRTQDVFLTDAGSYSFGIYTLGDKRVYSKNVKINPLDMSKLSSYNLSESNINGAKIDENGNGTDEIKINAEFNGTSFNIALSLYDSASKPLISGVDYNFVCYLKDDASKTPQKPKNPGTYIVAITYKGNYCGELDIVFEVEKADLSHYPMTINTTYGNAVENYITSFKLGDKTTGEQTEIKKGVDFEVVEVKGGNDYLSEGKVIVKTLNASQYLKGGTTVEWNYKVANRRDVSATFNGMTINNEKYPYTGKEIKPTNFKLARKTSDNTVVELVLDKDYKITGYKNNINPGKATAYVEFIGNYTGTAELYFTIAPAEACKHPKSELVGMVPASCQKDGYTGDQKCADCGVTLQKGTVIPRCEYILIKRPTITYCGTVQRPQITITDTTGKSLVYNKDFTIEWSNFYSTDVGTYTAKITLHGNYSDSRTRTYEIVPRTTVTPTLNRNTITCNNSVQRPSVTVKDDRGTALVYNKDFKVSYSNWNSKDVGRYTVTVTMMGNYSGEKTFPYYINPRPTSFKTSAQGGFKAQSKGFTLSWNKQSDITGYQIQYSTRSDFKNAATVYGGNANATSKTITGRAGNTRYYVRIRTYKNINGSYFYSDWNSGTKSIVTLR